jgi:hypothetical protein
MAKAKAVGFLLGAGVSIPCGAPTTAELTNVLLSGEIPYFRHTDTRYYTVSGVRPVHPTGIPTLPQIGLLLQKLRECISSYYAGRVEPQGCFVRAANYEDLAYLATQIAETIEGERDNPALTPFVNEIAAALGCTRTELRVLADEAVNLVRDHVCYRLSSLVPKSQHLRCLIEACAELGELQTPIVSLNHDCLIEGAFKEAGVPLCDMTKEDPSGMHRLDMRIAAKGATLFKLHGSIDWFRWRPAVNTEEDAFWNERVGSFESGLVKSGWRAVTARAEILVGRFNKELSYSGDPFAGLHAAARAAISNVDRILISGYSFGDKAVNTMLIDWVYSAPKGDRKIVVAHQFEEELVKSSRGAIGQRWEQWKSQGVLQCRHSFLADMSREDLRML